MTANLLDSKNPYQQFQGTTQWAILERALNQLIDNSDLEEKTKREYIVGFLCKALATNEHSASATTDEDMELAYVRSTIAKVQAMMRQANIEGVSMAQELFADRRRDAARE